MKSFKKYKKDYLLTFAVVLVAFVAVTGGGISDYANTKAWWIFWAVLQWVCIIACVLGWLFLKKQEKQRDKEQ